MNLSAKPIRVRQRKRPSHFDEKSLDVVEPLDTSPKAETDAETSYDVGYKKPPKHGQFKKGQSGNPKGRPKGARSFGAYLDDYLEQKVEVRDGNKVHEMRLLEVAARTLAKKAVSGNLPALMQLLKILGECGAANKGTSDAQGSETTSNETLSKSDREILTNPHLVVRF